MSKENEINLSFERFRRAQPATGHRHRPAIQPRFTPRWLHKLLPWVDVDGGVYSRQPRRQRRRKGKPANEFGEAKVDLLTVDGGEPKLPRPSWDYEQNPREYH